MSIENQLYGVPHWRTCASCGVTQPKKSLFQPLQPPPNDDGWHCINTAKCAEWKATLERAKPADIQQAAAQLCDVRQADTTLAELHQAGK